ncbi:hypothetical protein [Spiroplasma taiwanense]|uniref:Transmembrane protein n=1 Tax=Spiroplasma taiwanense CT-1 TaxID=1276220 RepID=S5LZX1_9MOLU|nr:hypothetical protein [Spiroplasma taiwanense]AGR41277.1 hypothetical protein STAIW_v1c06590 [Spiroplasma taiwanense CT-1]
MTNEQIISISGLVSSFVILIILIVVYYWIKNNRNYVQSNLAGKSNRDNIWNFLKKNILFFSILLMVVIVITFIAMTIQAF